ncbi:MAG: hypothetical protein LBC51_07805 [Treponema sp.]|nr:hypothetical protein [Treponema sp.]
MDTFLSGFITAFAIQDGRWYCWNVNGALGYLRKEGARWQSAFQSLPFQAMTGEFSGPTEAAPPQGLARSLTIGAGSEVSLRPLLNARPYLALMQEKLCLLPSAEARLVVLFPPVLCFETEDNQRIASFTPFTCPQAWFGDDTSEGILCCSLPSRCIINDPQSLGTYPRVLVRCPLVIRNRSKTPLELDRLAIYTEPLSLYEHEGYVWSDTVAMDSSLGGGDIEMNVLPDTPEAYRKIRGAARNGMGDILIRQGADFIKNITSL